MEVSAGGRCCSPCDLPRPSFPERGVGYKEVVRADPARLWILLLPRAPGTLLGSALLPAPSPTSQCRPDSLRNKQSFPHNPPPAPPPSESCWWWLFPSSVLSCLHLGQDWGNRSRGGSRAWGSVSPISFPRPSSKGWSLKRAEVGAARASERVRLGSQEGGERRAGGRGPPERQGPRASNSLELTVVGQAGQTRALTSCLKRKHFVFQDL